MDLKEIILNEFIQQCPDIFKHTEIIGVYDGSYHCKYFLNNYTFIETITFYENFSIIKNPEEFIKIYKNWESSIPNLKIKLEDGKNFTKHSTYIHIDTSNDELYNFVTSNWKKLKNKQCISFYAYSNNPCNTLSVSKLILEDKYFPFLLHEGIIFGSPYFELYKKNYSKILDIFTKNNINFTTEYMNAKIEYPIINTNNGWKDRVERGLSNQ